MSLKAKQQKHLIKSRPPSSVCAGRLQIQENCATGAHQLLHPSPCDSLTQLSCLPFNTYTHGVLGGQSIRQTDRAHMNVHTRAERDAHTRSHTLSAGGELCLRPEFLIPAGSRRENRRGERTESFTRGFRCLSNHSHQLQICAIHVRDSAVCNHTVAV